jgi:multiple sugar transport system ATP-binding protein
MKGSDRTKITIFIGSPAMNCFDVTVAEQDGNLCVDSSSFRLMLPPDKAQAVRAYIGKQVIFGTRPEDIHACEYTPPGHRTELLTASVDVTEMSDRTETVQQPTANRRQPECRGQG